MTNPRHPTSPALVPVLVLVPGVPTKDRFMMLRHLLKTAAILLLEEAHLLLLNGALVLALLLTATPLNILTA